MTKKAIFLALSLAISFQVVSCGGTPSETPSSNPSVNTSVSDVLLDPVFEWADLYVVSAFRTITGVVSNPNDVDIDISYDVVYYKDGVEVHRNEDWSCISVPSNGKAVIWGNVDIPKADDVDEIKFENVYFCKSYYTQVKGTVTFKETVGDNVYFNYSLEKDITYGYIYVVFYDDKNSNNKIDKGEIVVACIENIDTKNGTFSFDMSDRVYTNYEIFINAY